MDKHILEYTRNMSSGRNFCDLRAHTHIYLIKFRFGM